MSSSICFSLLDLRTTINKIVAIATKNTTAIVIKRASTLAHGWDSPKPISGPMNQIKREKATATNSVVAMPERNLFSKGRIMLRLP
jgi:hypothetical protein